MQTTRRFPLLLAIIVPTVLVYVFFFLATLLRAGGGSYRTKNFVVDAPTAEQAEHIGLIAEQDRRDLAIAWLGAELPDWTAPCPIHAQVNPQLGCGGATSFMFDNGEVFDWRMNLQGSEQRILDSGLPHEVTHTIFATHFRRPLPRWADEGGAITMEAFVERSKNDRLLVTFLQTGRGIPFSTMLAMTDYPQDIVPLYAQGYSLARYLIGQKGRAEYLVYLSDGMTANDWIGATERHYGFKNLKSLQDTWLDWVKRGSPQETAVAVTANQCGGGYGDCQSCQQSGMTFRRINVVPQVFTPPLIQRPAGGLGIATPAPRATASSAPPFVPPKVDLGTPVAPPYQSQTLVPVQPTAKLVPGPAGPPGQTGPPGPPGPAADPAALARIQAKLDLPITVQIVDPSGAVIDSSSAKLGGVIQFQLVPQHQTVATK